MKTPTTTLPIVLYHTHCARIARAYAHGGAGLNYGDNND